VRDISLESDGGKRRREARGAVQDFTLVFLDSVRYGLEMNWLLF
jgi:hypothetical protein